MSRVHALPKLTPKAMRRTWKDVARTAGIEKVVRKAVCVFAPGASRGPPASRKAHYWATPH